MDHSEIRFRFLQTLYQKYYNGENKKPLNPNDIVKESGLDAVNSNLVSGDVLYLLDKGLIQGEHMLGYAMPFFVNISAYGIDTVENIMKYSLEEIQRKVPSNEEMVKIQKETEPPKKYQRLWEYVKQHPDLLITIVEKTTKFVTGF